MRKVIDGAFDRFRWLVLGNAVSIMISALATILLARIMGPEIYGNYTIALVLPSSLNVIADIGINSAIIYYISSYRGDERFIGTYFRTGLILAVLWSALIVSMLVITSSIVAQSLFHRDNLSDLLKVSSLIILSSAGSSICIGALISLQRQKIIGIYLILMSIFRNSLSLVLFLKMNNVFVAILGQVIGYLLSSIALIIYTIRSTPGGNFDREVIRIILSYGAPYAVGLFVLSLCVQFYNIIAAMSFDDFTYGNFSVAWFIFTGVMTIPNSLSKSLFPSISESGIKSKFSVATVFNSSVKFASSLLLYMWITLGGASNVIISLIYGSRYTLAGNIFILLSVVFVFGIIGWGVINPLLLSLKKTKVLAAINISSVLISLLFLNYVFLPMFASDIWAIPLAFAMLHGLATIMGLIYLKAKYKIKLPRWSSIKLFLIVMGLFVVVRKISLLNINISITILKYTIDLMMIIKIVSVFVGIGVAYIVLLIAFRVITREDYEIMKSTLLSSPKISWLVGKIAEKAFILGDKLDEFSQRIGIGQM